MMEIKILLLDYAVSRKCKGDTSGEECWISRKKKKIKQRVFKYHITSLIMYSVL